MHKHLLLLLTTLISILMNTACQQEESAKQEKEINMDYVPEYINLWPAMQAPDQVYYLWIENCAADPGIFKNLRSLSFKNGTLDSTYNKSFMQLDALKEIRYHHCTVEQLEFSEQQKNSVDVFMAWDLDVKDTNEFLKQLSELKSLKTLALGNCSFSSVSDYFLNHKTIKKIQLGGDVSKINYKESIENLARIESLEGFEIIISDIKHLPENIDKLHHLTHFGIYNCPEIEIQEVIQSILNWKGLKSLRITDLRIREVPQEIEQLQGLRKVEFWNNKNLNIPQALEVLSKLEQLEELDISSCMSNVPSDSTTGMLDDLPKLQNLKKLDMSYNLYFKSEYYWGIISQLSQLEELRMIRGGNHLLTQDINKLTKLKKLDISEGRSISFDEVTELPALEVLNYDGSMVKEFPEVLLQTTSLVSLSLFNNEIKEIPAEISNLVNLEHLDISNNPITELPESIKELKDNLEYLDILSTPLAQNPAKVAQLKEWLPNTMIFTGK